ncbi:hypothetical protein CDD83_5689 [Cordyceps sp. RAO-2017]|nr:hypothetical protein CDD83_5689 [Cordyceps sp. RAO-2017]
MVRITVAALLALATASLAAPASPAEDTTEGRLPSPSSSPPPSSGPSTLNSTEDKVPPPSPETNPSLDEPAGDEPEKEGGRSGVDDGQSQENEGDVNGGNSEDYIKLLEDQADFFKKLADKEKAKTGGGAGGSDTKDDTAEEGPEDLDPNKSSADPKPPKTSSTVSPARPKDGKEVGTSEQGTSEQGPSEQDPSEQDPVKGEEDSVENKKKAE